MRMFALVAIGIGVMIGAAGKGDGGGGQPAGLKITQEPDRVLVRWSGPVSKLSEALIAAAQAAAG